MKAKQVKTATPDKSAPRKPAAPRKAAAPATLKDKLAAELASLIPELDEEGLSFLIEQARVHLYNMDIDRQEAEARASGNAGVAAMPSTSATTGASGAPSAADASAPRVSSPANFRIERAGGGS